MQYIIVFAMEILGKHLKLLRGFEREHKPKREIHIHTTNT